MEYILKYVNNSWGILGRRIFSLQGKRDSGKGDAEVASSSSAKDKDEKGSEEEESEEEGSEEEEMAAAMAEVRVE